jgi:PAS domain S-box-containing protein
MLHDLDASIALAELHASEDGLVWVNDDGIVLFFNDAARALFGREFIGTNISECAEKYEVLRLDGSPCPADELPLYRAALKRERVRAHCRIRRPDGEVRDVLADATPLHAKDGSSAGALLRMRDVTEREALARVLRLSERRFKALAAATAQMTWSADAAGLVQDPSPSWQAFTGQTTEEWRGYGWMDVVHADDRARVREVWLAAVAARAPYEVEYRVRRRDGVYRWTVARGAPIFGDDGSVQEWVGCNWDVHALKDAEEEQARKAGLLRTLLAVIGHDLRNPLSSILMAAAALQATSDPMTRTTAARIARGAQRAAGILDVLLDLTEAELAGGIRLQPTPGDLAEVVAEILAEIEDQSPGRRLESTIVGDTLGIFDRTRIGQVVSNLVANAVHHGTPATPIKVRVRGSAEDLEVIVENHAVPIPPETISTLFDPFRRGAGAASMKEGRRNLGLGLHIVAQIVEAHRGVVSADSTTERTRFSFRIPRRVA